MSLPILYPTILLGEGYKYHSLQAEDGLSVKTFAGQGDVHRTVAKLHLCVSSLQAMYSM